MKIKNKEKFKEKLLDLINIEDDLLEEEESFVKNDVMEFINSFILIESLNASIILNKFPEFKQYVNDEFNDIVEKVKSILLEEIELYYLIEWDEIYNETYSLLDIPERKNIQPKKFECDNELIEKLFSQEISQLHFKDQFYGEINYRVLVGNIQNEKDLSQQGKEIFEENFKHESIYFDIINEWGKEVIIDLSEEKEKRFIDYEQGVCSLSDIEEKEYRLIYLSVLPYYLKYLCTKKQKLKPIINKFPDYINYSKQIIKDLFNYDIVKENKDKIEYVSNDKIENFAQQIFTYK